MSNPVQQLHEQREYCLAEMQRIREMWGNKTTFTEKNIDAAEQSLSMILLYCPEELRDHAASMLDELSRRKFYLLFKTTETRK